MTKVPNSWKLTAEGLSVLISQPYLCCSFDLGKVDFQWKYNLENYVFSFSIFWGKRRCKCTHCILFVHIESLPIQLKLKKLKKNFDGKILVLYEKKVKILISQGYKHFGYFISIFRGRCGTKLCPLLVWKLPPPTTWNPH